MSESCDYSSSQLAQHDRSPSPSDNDEDVAGQSHGVHDEPIPSPRHASTPSSSRATEDDVIKVDEDWIDDPNWTFDQWLLEYIKYHNNLKGTHFITDDEYAALVLATKDRSSIEQIRNKTIKTYIKNQTNRNRFMMISVKKNGSITEALAQVRPENKFMNSLSANDCYRVVPASEIAQVITDVHCKDARHSGHDKTYARIRNDYKHINRLMVRAFVARCHACQARKKKQFKNPLTPIISKAMFERIVIDLIDYQHSVSGRWKFIAMAVDHVSKFHWARALTSKHAYQVVDFVESIFASIGAPKLLQSDNGTEFCNAEMDAVTTKWNIRFVHSAVYYPQTNGIVERANQHLENT